jgi:hypothetical protein
MTPATARTSKPRLGTTWHVFRHPRRPRHTTRVRDSQSHSAKQTRRHGTFQPRSRTFPNVPNVPKRSGSTHLRKCITHRRPAQQRKRDVSTASRDVLPAFQNVPKRPRPPVVERRFPDRMAPRRSVEAVTLPIAVSTSYCLESQPNGNGWWDHVGYGFPCPDSVTTCSYDEEGHRAC